MWSKKVLLQLSPKATSYKYPVVRKMCDFAISGGSICYIFNPRTDGVRARLRRVDDRWRVGGWWHDSSWLPPPRWWFQEARIAPASRKSNRYPRRGLQRVLISFLFRSKLGSPGVKRGRTFRKVSLFAENQRHLKNILARGNPKKQSVAHDEAQWQCAWFKCIAE